MHQFRKWLNPRLPALGILAGVLLINASAFWREVGLARADQNDYTAHYALVMRVVNAVERGENPLDAWSSEWTFGYPQLRTYPSLSHDLVAGAYFACGKAISLHSIFITCRYLSVVLLPLSFFAMTMMLGFEPMVAAAAAALAPLPVTDRLYGLEFGSYSWAGQGLFAQAVATHFMLIAIGCGWRAVRGRGSIALAGLLAGLTFLAHFIFGYIAAMSVVLMVLVPGAAVPWRKRLMRAAGAGLVAIAVASGQLLVLWQDRAITNHSIWEPLWKWNSFGAPAVLRWLFTGQLVDFGRLPVLSLLAAAGVLMAVWLKVRLKRLAPRRIFLLAGAVFWILLFFGRPFWGRALVLLGVPPDFQLHRVIAAVHTFMVLLAATGLVAIWRALDRLHPVAATLGVALVLYPAAAERHRYLVKSSSDSFETLARYDNAREDLEKVADLVRNRGGRMTVTDPRPGELPLQMFFDAMQIPIVPHTRHSMSLTSELLFNFRAFEEYQYELFNVRTIAAEQADTSAYAFIKPLQWVGSIHVFDAPGHGYFRLVDVAGSIPTNRDSFLRINDLWLSGEWARKKQHLWLDFGDAPRDLPRIAESALKDPPPEREAPGTVVHEEQKGEDYSAEVEAARDTYVLFSMTWHPNWRVDVDGRPQPTMMLSPGFLGVRIPAGRHRIECRYRPGPAKIVLTLAGLAVAIVAGIRRKLY